jgi:GT2 family glycosyltransferase
LLLPPEASICIPTLKGYDRLMRLLRSIEAHTPVDYEVVIVDSGSRVRGYTTPMNQALRAARGKFLLALNDDIEVSGGWIEPLLEQARAGVWACTPDMTHTDGPQVFAPYCLCLRREAFEALGGLDERFVLWASDIDLARRLIEAGRPPVKVLLPNPIRHEVSATTGAHPEVAHICQEDLERYREKWGVDANCDKAALVAQVGVGM